MTSSNTRPSVTPSSGSVTAQKTPPSQAREKASSTPARAANSGGTPDRVTVSKDSKEPDKHSGVNLSAWNDGSTNQKNQAGKDLAASLGDQTLRSGMHNESVRSLQTALNQQLGLELETDGKYGPQTQNAVRKFQREHGLKPVDGIVGPKTRSALTGLGGKALGKTKKNDSKKSASKRKEGPKGDGRIKTGTSNLAKKDRSRGKLSFGKKLSKGQKEAVHKMVDDLKTKGFLVTPDDIVNFIAVETGGTFNPSMRSGGKRGGAVGLAQFTGTAIKDMNRFRSSGNKLSKSRLSKMNFAQQSKVVTEYLSRVLERRGMKGKRINAADLYSAVFAPRAVGRSTGSTIYSRGSRAYRSNRSLDTNRDGRITKAELVARLRAWALRGQQLSG